MHRGLQPLFGIFCLGLVPVYAQENLAELLREPGMHLADDAARGRVVERMGRIETDRRTRARAKAAAAGMPLRRELPNGRIMEIHDFDGPRPVYFITHNVNAAISTGANLLQASPYSLNGSGLTIGMWDGGSGRPTHQEFAGRMVNQDGSASIDHATHVCGTMIASGVVASARGMATAATVDSYDWNSDITEMTSRGATAPGQESTRIYLSNHSYGYISGWNNVAGTGTPARTWEWNGTGTSTTSIEDDFGRYNTYSRDVDTLAFNAPYYLVFQSAGNERIDNPATGQTVALAPGSTSVVTYDPAVHPAGDGNYRGGFETISFRALAKNVVTVGSVTDAVTSGNRDAAKAASSSFSSWGPTDDGRIKPDVVANGDGVYSSLNGSDTSYGTYSGTSMSSPNACGTAALLIQQYNALFPGDAMRAATLKALLIHTATDLGNPGPDYKFGWGLIHAKAAADLIRDHFANPLKKRIIDDQLTTSVSTISYPFVWDQVSPIRATLAWTDPAGTSTTTSDLRTARLVNNLNLKLIAPNGSEYLPYVMPFVGSWTQESMNANATTGVNNTDNVEQIHHPAPAVAGTWQVVVTYSGTLTNSQQRFSIILDGAAAEVPPPPPVALTALSPTSGLAGTLATIDFTGTSLGSDTLLKLTKSGQSEIPASSRQMVGSTLRCQFNLAGAATGAWSVVATNPDASSSTLSDAFTVVGSIWNETFDGTLSGWTSTAPLGTNVWSLTTAQSHSPTKSWFAPAPSTRSTTYLTSSAIPIPSSANNLQFKFWHNYNLQSTYDAGRLEFSVDGGTTWFDAASAGSGTSFASNGYNTTITYTGRTSRDNPFANYPAWSGNSGGFIETIVNLTDTAKFAGKNLRARWCLSTNSTTASTGWYVDSVSVIGDANTANQAPAITSSATSSSTETETDTEGLVWRIERGTSATLSVVANDDGGVGNLSYTWSISGPATAFVSPNSGNSASTTTAEFTQPGGYTATVTVTDALGLAASSAVNLRVVQTASGLVVSPAVTAVTVAQSQNFTATLNDQFGNPMSAQPSSFAWSVSGGGGITSGGFFTATTAGGPYAVSATSGSFTNFASVTVHPATASVALENLTQTYDGTAKHVTASTNPVGLAVTVTYNGNPAAPSDAGNYPIVATITDPNYQGGTTGTLVIEKATASVTLENLAQTYDGTAKHVTVSTNPVGLAVTVTYNGSPAAPSDAGSYPVVATITDPNYQGGTTGTLVIEKATASVVLENLAQTYDGTAKSVTASTNPVGLAVTVTYNGSPAAPSDAGSHPVVATIADPNYQGGTTGTLVIEKATAQVTLENLAQTYDGTAKSVTVSTNPVGLAVTVTYNGSPSAPSDAGNYPIVATITDPNYQGGTTGTLVIEKATASVVLENLAQTYDGTAKSVTASTNPVGLAVTVTYNGSPAAPSDAGSYPVVATIADPNYQGGTTGTLVIEKATASVALENLAQTYDGTAKHVTVSTNPVGLAVTVTYNCNPAAPSDAGSHSVEATITDPNYQGGTTGTLVIELPDPRIVWKTEHFTEPQILEGLADDLADPDADGLCNLAEYALGSDPWRSSSLPSARLDENGLTLVLTRPLGRTGVICTAESSDDLITWSPLPPLEVIHTTETTETLRASAPLNQGNAKMRFIRLRFVRE